MLNPSLEGNFAPVREEVALTGLKVLGKLPAGLDGLFVRNGPNPQFRPLRNHHWFDGDGMLHGVRIRDGGASYRNRYIRTPGWRKENACGKSLYGSFLDPVSTGMILRHSWNMLARRELMKNTANTALAIHHGRVLALWEAGCPHEIRPTDLETIGPHDFGGKLKHWFTAHPKIDAETGEMLCFGYNPFRPVVWYSIVNAAGELVSTTPIRIRRPIMMHDFAITGRYTIFMDMPLTFHVMRALRGRPVLEFEPDLGARIGILPRYGKDADIRWFEVAAGQVFHTLNAYEDGDEIVLLACRTSGFPDSFFRPSTGGPIIGPEFAPVMYRWRVNMTTNLVREEPLDELASDFPRLNDRFVGKKARYGYTSSLMTGPGPLVKYDFARGHTSRHSLGSLRISGEAVFVSRPDPKAEDDGWVITYVHDEAGNRSELIVIEASDFDAPPVARVQIPVRVPYGFHAAWIPGELAG